MRAALLCLLLLLLGGCATRGALDISCPQFAELRHDLPLSPLEQEIHGDTGQHSLAVAAPAQQADLTRRFSDTMGVQRPQAVGVPRGEPAVVLLSGGGQWGAFGAGYLDQLRRDGKLPAFAVVTGVSTGSLQSLFVAVDSDESYAALLRAYAPASEKEIVDRGPTWTALFTGSFAGLKPLRKRIEQALCPDAALTDPNQRCTLDALRELKGRKTVLIGFVRATSGTFQYVDAVDVAALPRPEARACLTGAALASAAMPVDFQQVKINHETYYDGGTRSSVFEANIAAAADAAIRLRHALLGDQPAPGTPEPLLPIYVVRNGPTTVVPEPDVDTKGDALTAAMRAEAIVVNQLEVGSIAAIRIEHPTGALRLVTADDWTKVGCIKPPGVMFDPTFMQCLTALGRTRAQASEPWIDLSPIAAPHP